MRKLWLLLAALLTASTVSFADVMVGAGKDFSSFTEAIYDTVDSQETVIVYPGVYDIRQEFADLFGDDVPEIFQRGIFLHDRTVQFLPGSRLICIWDRDDNFSPIYSGGNVVLDGLYLYAEGTLYAIHDDLWHWDAPYINEYRHCRVTGRLLKNANCIGGGVARNARIIIDCCYFDNGVADSITVRYHNIDIPESTGDIWITNSYFNGYLALCYYGWSAHLDVYVNGCKAKKVETRKETPHSWVRNIDLYAWNNQ